MATTENLHTGDASKTKFSFTFPYLNQTDVEVYKYVTNAWVKQTETTHYTFDNATTIKFGSAPAAATTAEQALLGNAKNIKIKRNTSGDSLAATFYPGSAIRSVDLNDNYTQNLYVTQEASNAVTNANTDAAAAVVTSDNAKSTADDAADDVKRWIKDGDGTDTTGNEDDADFTQRPLKPKGVPYAVAQAEAAVDTADDAEDKADAADAIADAAKLATDTYVHNGTSLQGDGIGGNPQGVKYAVVTADAAKAESSQAQADATAADAIADAAKLATDRLVATTSNSGTSWTVAGNNTNASTDPKGVGWAITQGEAGKVAGDAAKLASDRLVATTSNGGTSWTLAGNNTNASTDPKGVGYAVTTAEAAKTSADASAAAVADAVLYTTVANKAALEAVNPSEDGYYEVTDSTGLANGTWQDDVDSSITYTMSGIPGTYPNTQMDGITSKFQYTHSSKTYAYKSYVAVDGDDRYMVGPASDGSNGQFLQTNGAGVKTWSSTFITPITVGVDDAGHDVKFFGDTAGAHLLWDTSADSLLTAGGATVDIVKDKLKIGGTAVTTTAAELNKLDGVTATTAELNLVNGVTAGTVSASKAVIVDANKDLTGLNDVTIAGDLTVNGTTTTINSTTLQVDDKNIELGTVSTPSDTTADGGGITLKGASDKTITWVNSTDTWDFNQGIKITGTGTFTSDLAVGSDPNWSAATDTGIAAYVSAPNKWFGIKNSSSQGAGYNSFQITHGSDNTTVITNGGAATFAGSVTSSEAFTSNRSGSSVCFYAQSSGTTNASITAAGAATFAGLMKSAYIQVEVAAAGNNNLYGGNSYFGGTGDSSGNANANIMNTGAADFTTVADSKGDLRRIPQNSQGSAYTLVAADAGKHILASGTVTVPQSTFAAGDAVTIVNNTASDLAITSQTTMYNAADGADTNYTLSARGVATILWISSTVCHISGAGLS